MLLLNIILSTLVISVVSLAGILLLPHKHRHWPTIVFLIVAMAAGTLMGGAFLHLLPESVEALGEETPFIIALASFIGFFALERFFFWRHCHKEDCDLHSFGFLNLIGDGLHNLVDGLLIAAAFVTDPALGWATALGVALHEIPQEIGDFGVLLHSGFSRQKALLANLLVALTAVVGGVVGFFLTQQSELLASMLLPVAAGGFIYIAASDLMPEIREEKRILHAMLAFVAFLAGVTMMLMIE